MGNIKTITKYTLSNVSQSATQRIDPYSDQRPSNVGKGPYSRHKALERWEKIAFCTQFREKLTNKLIGIDYYEGLNAF